MKLLFQILDQGTFLQPTSSNITCERVIAYRHVKWPCGAEQLFKYDLLLTDGSMVVICCGWPHAELISKIKLIKALKEDSHNCARLYKKDPAAYADLLDTFKHSPAVGGG